MIPPVALHSRSLWPARYGSPVVDGMETHSCTLAVPCDLKMLSPARAFLENLCQVHNLDRAMTHAIVLATAEAVTNIVRHGGNGDSSGQIHIHFKLTGDAVEIRIIDDCSPFDISSVPNLDPREMRVGGRGVYLMRALMDELTCEHHDAGGNTLRMVKRLRPSA